MKCKSCGHVIDSNMRFCTYCDHDNYPEMNTVHLKGDKTANKYPNAKNTVYSKSYTSNSHSTNQKVLNNNTNTNSNNKKANNQNTGCLVIAVIIFILFVIFSAALGE